MPTIQRDGLALHYERHGRGPALVLVHSFLCSGAMWESQVAALAEDYTLINVDIRGHGRSDPPRRPFSIYDLMEDVLAIMDREGIDSAVWAGLSIGGMVALRAAVKAPQRVRALVVMDSHAGPERIHKKIQYRAMVLAAQVVGVRPLLGKICKLMFSDFTLHNQRELVARWREHFATLPMASISRGVTALSRRDSMQARISLISKPTLVIVGAQDRSLPPAFSREIARNIEGAELVEIPRAGHLVALEQPEAVNEALQQFLQALPPVAGAGSSSPEPLATEQP